jgi:hypothetical protein
MTTYSRTTTIVYGREAIIRAKAADVSINKYQDPTEDAAIGLTVVQAEAILSEDPSLIWAEVPCCDHVADRERGEE